MSRVIVVRGRVARRVREEAKRLGVSVDEYVVELLSQGLDPRDRSVEYVRQAAEMMWGQVLSQLRHTSRPSGKRGCPATGSCGSTRGG